MISVLSTIILLQCIIMYRMHLVDAHRYSAECLIVARNDFALEYNAQLKEGEDKMHYINFNLLEHSGGYYKQVFNIDKWTFDAFYPEKLLRDVLDVKEDV